MKEKIITSGRIFEGRLTLEDKDIRQKIKVWEGRAVVLEIYLQSDRITHNQRKYFYGVIVNVLLQFYLDNGYEVDHQDVVDHLKDKFMYQMKLSSITGEYVKVPISLSDSDEGMNQEEFQEKKEQIQRYYSGSVDIPDPDKNWRLWK